MLLLTMRKNKLDYELPSMPELYCQPPAERNAAVEKKRRYPKKHYPEKYAVGETEGPGPDG